MAEDLKQLEGGAYEVIRARLEKHGQDLTARLERLNTRRLEVFGGVETKLLATERVATEHNCTARDLVAIGPNRFLFGYNIQFGLKQTTEVRDVFAVYDFDAEKNTFRPVTDSTVDTDPHFLADFRYLYKFYRDTVFKKFLISGPHLYMAMRAGKTLDDIKVFKWKINGDGTLQYLGNRFDHEYVYPPQHEFTWKRAHRDMQRGGVHPHISIEDKMFIETIGGDLTIKVEDNTETGMGIYSEPVTDADQTLDDAEIFYATVGSLILLKVLPYREQLHRYLIFHQKTKTVQRIDAIGSSCVLLPDDQGVIFANGYCLQTGECKTFDHGIDSLRFERRIISANGEDVLFVFYKRELGEYVLLAYNRISQAVDTPIICAGSSMFADGTLVYFKGSQEAQKYHSLQIWRTPFFDDAYAIRTAKNQEDILFKIGNPVLVRGMAECREVLSLLAKDDSFSGLYVDLLKKSGDLLDAHFWISSPDCEDLAAPLKEVKKAAQSAISEFEKVVALREAAKQRMSIVGTAVEKMVSTSKTTISDNLADYVHLLSGMRKLRGEIISLREVRHTDPTFIADCEKRIIEASDLISEKTITFLGTEKALSGYAKTINEQEGGVPTIKGSVDADNSLKILDDSAAELEMLIDVVGGLKIKDPAQTTALVESITTLYARLNGVRGAIRNKRKELTRGEAQAEFIARINLLGQAMANHLDLADTPQKCDEALTKLMVTVEELEGKFSEFDEYVEQLSIRREEIYSAFDGRRAQLLDSRNRRANGLLKSAERILNGVKSRVATFSEQEEIQGYFAGDLMIEKLREIITELQSLGDTVKADDVQTRLKTLREDSVRQLKDKRELFADGGNNIQFGKHKFSVNQQALELSIVPHNGEMAFHLSGTKFFEPLNDPAFDSYRDLWEREVASESATVYRAEYLAWRALERDPHDLQKSIAALIQEHPSEAYTKGIHDVDALAITQAIAPVRDALGYAAHGPDTRALAMLFWHAWEKRPLMEKRLHALRASFSLGQMAEGRHDIEGEMELAIIEFLKHSEAAHIAATCCGEAAHTRAPSAAKFLFDSLLTDKPFVTSREAEDRLKAFDLALIEKNLDTTLANILLSYAQDPSTAFQILIDWFQAALTLQDASSINTTPPFAWLAEAAAHKLTNPHDSRHVVNVATAIRVEKLLGSHPLIVDSIYQGEYHAISRRLEKFRRDDVPRYQEYTRLKHQLVSAKRDTLRLDTFKPRVMSSFVRNRLIDEVYLPIIGDNLAKQLGSVGDQTRTDRMGLLLLISPPGYGKTTLVEYVADRLGLTYIKINGPALGTRVLSLDPAEAPNAAAREEIERLNLALEMGDNIMIVIDDIQHTDPEFLQKFISLCDGQRKIEGVFRGKAKTYDLRGRKVCVVMAGNPYTEHGGKFQIPDMLANRADTYNLGDILGGHGEAFKASYIENCLTSNSILSKLASRSPKDIHILMRVAATGSREGADFEGNYTPAEIEDMLAVTKHLLRVREVISRVNEEYIRSAAQEENYRTEPSFRLQGSYRNMNRIAEKILPLMTPEEIEQVLMDHYRGESQNLTTAAEANMLKLREMLGTISPDEQARWTQIKKDFGKNKLLGGSGENDPVARVVAQMSQFTDGLDAIRDGISKAGEAYARPQSLADATVAQLQSIIAGLRAVPVAVEIKVVPVEAPSPQQLPVDIKPTVEQNE